MIIEKAILKINPNAEFKVSADDVNRITWLNGTTPIPVADIQAQIPVVETEIEQEETNRTNARTSAINKLKGATYSALTDAEAKALFGE
tara:strand:- start:13 stop:279 length:267 start_codon:yes stop_codon:yes gene_type:complete